jgi:hypothetical protein
MAVSFEFHYLASGRAAPGKRRLGMARQVPIATPILPRRTVWPLADPEDNLHLAHAFSELQLPTRRAGGSLCESQSDLARRQVQLRRSAALAPEAPSAGGYPVNYQFEQYGSSFEFSGLTL